MLERVGFRGHSLQIFKSYLNLRKYCVKISNNLSDETTVEHGVPQGSKLGPILYLIYSNELINTLQISKVFAYADDTAIVVAHKNLDDATKILQHELDIATKWCHDYGLTINASKTKLMHIKPNHFLYNDIKIKFHNIECIHDNRLNNFNYTSDKCTTLIEIVNQYKYLGVIVDQNFKWKFHIDEIRKKLRKAAFILHRLSYCSNNFVMRQVYFSLAESHIRHGITAWGSSTHCSKLQHTQNQLLKILNSNHLQQHNNTNNEQNYNTSNLASSIPTNTVIFNNTSNVTSAISNNTNNLTSAISNNTFSKDVNILNVKNIYKTTLAIEFFNDEKFLHKINHIYPTRRNTEGRYTVPQFSNEYGRKSLSVMIPTIFNNIPTSVLSDANNNNRRKKTLKSYFISQQ